MVGRRVIPGSVQNVFLDAHVPDSALDDLRVLVEQVVGLAVVAKVLQVVQVLLLLHLLLQGLVLLLMRHLLHQVGLDGLLVLSLAGSLLLFPADLLLVHLARHHVLLHFVEVLFDE